MSKIATQANMCPLRVWNVLSFFHILPINKFEKKKVNSNHFKL